MSGVVASISVGLRTKVLFKICGRLFPLCFEGDSDSVR